MSAPTRASNLTQLNMKLVVERASEILGVMSGPLQMGLSAKLMLAKGMLKELETEDDTRGDIWEILSWQVVLGQLQEQEIAEDDPTYKKPQGFNGGWSVNP